MTNSTSVRTLIRPFAPSALPKFAGDRHGLAFAVDHCCRTVVAVRDLACPLRRDAVGRMLCEEGVPPNMMSELRGKDKTASHMMFLTQLLQPMPKSHNCEQILKLTELRTMVEMCYSNPESRCGYLRKTDCAADIVATNLCHVPHWTIFTHDHLPLPAKNESRRTFEQLTNVFRISVLRTVKSIELACRLYSLLCWSSFGLRFGNAGEGCSK